MLLACRSMLYCAPPLARRSQASRSSGPLWRSCKRRWSHKLESGWGLGGSALWRWCNQSIGLEQSSYARRNTSGRKNIWFLLSRHDVRRLLEKFSSWRFERAIGCYTHFGLLSPKTFDSYFLDMMYVEFMKNFHLASWNKLIAVRLISAFWAQKRLIPIF